MNEIKITLLWNPISTQNAYWQKGKVRYMKNKAKLMKLSYINQIRAQYKGGLLEYPLIVKIELYFWSKHIRDWDNWHKISMDALEWIVVENDSQFDCDWVYRHYDKENPRIELVITRNNKKSWHLV